MSHITLACTECKHRHKADMLTLHCNRCGSPLDVEYKNANRHSMEWHGFTMPVPFHSDYPTATMGEGHTPIVPMTRVSENLGHSNIFGKLELMNPTGSFKDRGAAAMLSVAVEQGVREVVEDSSGNAGAAIAAYAARVGIKAHIFAPSNAPKAKMTQIRVYGAETHPVTGPREASAEAAIQYQREHRTVYASHNLSPYFLEGTKTFAYEVAAQMTDGPDHIVIPVGNGSLLIGAWKGYRELLSMGVVSKIPKLHAIQAEAVKPIAAQFARERWTAGGSTIAGGISVGAPPRKSQVIRAISETGGVAVSVSDESILRWQMFLASSEGIFAEPTSAAALSGLEALIGSGTIGPDETVLVAITGFGLKDALPPAYPASSEAS